MPRGKSGKSNMKKLFSGIYDNRRVIVTGSTGFKGSWLVYWLEKMGAYVTGFALTPTSEPSHFNLLTNTRSSRTVIGDIRDRNALTKVFHEVKPEIVFHMAAQPLVRESYRDPFKTYETNVIGTLNVYDACRNTPEVRAIVSITTDKVYENREWMWGYRENEALGGYDPYSSSKACAEILSESYRRSFWNVNDYKKKHTTLLATVRAGNVIGGGDWAEDRLICDIMRSLAASKRVRIRNPHATRPWQHVLEPLSGYLLVGEKLLEENTSCSCAWNFGPKPEVYITVKEMLGRVKIFWNDLEYEFDVDADAPHEAGLLSLDITKARILLGWNPVWRADKTIEKTVLWYRNFYLNNKIMTLDDLTCYIEDAKKAGALWA
jgi:CDP-glucose 4,6-dehydratase